MSNGNKSFLAGVGKEAIVAFCASVIAALIVVGYMYLVEHSADTPGGDTSRMPALSLPQSDVVFNRTPRRNCGNVVTRITVPAGGTVWGTIKAQIIKTEQEYPPIDGPSSASWIEALTKRTVDTLQADIDADPSLKVRDLDRVWPGFQIDLAIDTSVMPVSGQ